MALLVYTLERPMRANRLGCTLSRKLKSIPATLYLPLAVLYLTNISITRLYAFPLCTGLIAVPPF